MGELKMDFSLQQRIHDLAILWLSRTGKTVDKSPEELVAMYKKVHDQIGEILSR